MENYIKMDKSIQSNWKELVVLAQSIKGCEIRETEDTVSIIFPNSSARKKYSGLADIFHKMKPKH